jgi:hypothetical protein
LSATEKATAIPIPTGNHTLSPDSQKRPQSIACYAHAFSAKELMRLSVPGKEISRIEISDSRLMLADAPRNSRPCYENRCVPAV